MFYLVFNKKSFTARILISFSNDGLVLDYYGVRDKFHPDKSSHIRKDKKTLEIGCQHCTVISKQCYITLYCFIVTEPIVFQLNRKTVKLLEKVDARKCFDQEKSLHRKSLCPFYK